MPSRLTPCFSYGITCAAPATRTAAALPNTRLISLFIIVRKVEIAASRGDGRNYTPPPLPPLSAQGNDRPAPSFGVCAQGRVGVDRDRMFYSGKQRQIVERIAVEPGFPETAPTPAVRRQPMLHAHHLAIAEARHAGDVPGEFAVLL